MSLITIGFVMLNYIWLGLMVFAVLIGGYTQSNGAVTIVRYTDLLQRFCRFACTEFHRDAVAPSEVDKMRMTILSHGKTV